MGFHQLSPMLPRLPLRVVHTLRRESHQLTGFEKIHVASFKELAHITWEVKNRRVFADETKHPG